jgi:hypothetical protein
MYNLLFTIYLQEQSKPRKMGRRAEIRNRSKPGLFWLKI